MRPPAFCLIHRLSGWPECERRLSGTGWLTERHGNQQAKRLFANYTFW